MHALAEKKTTDTRSACQCLESLKERGHLRDVEADDKKK
jgi:hypothetical protein